MKEYSIFDMIGPVMIGPSSSHTAGACRIGFMARSIMRCTPVQVSFHLFGSFARTYRGHGTDLALLGGFLGFRPDDERITNAIALARDAELDAVFVPGGEEVDHPNTVVIRARCGDGRSAEIRGVSLGGGKVVITAINGIEVEYTGEYTTIVTSHRDHPGMIARIAASLAGAGVNIANMRLYRRSRGERAICIIENDDRVPDALVRELQQLEGMHQVTLLEKVYD